MKKILIVDDEYLVRIGIRSITDWEAHGYEVVGEAQNGKQALEMIQCLQPDIVLTDLKMEPVDGLEVLRKSAKDFPAVQFVVLSSYNDFDNVRVAMKLGARDYLFKLSVTEEELLRVLEEIPVATTAESVLSVEGRELMKTQLFRKLIHRDYLSGEQLGEELHCLDGRLCWSGRYRALLLDVDNFILLEQAEGAGGTSLFKFALQNIVQEVVQEQLGGVVINYDRAQLLALLPQEAQETTEGAVACLVDLLEEYACRYLGVAISVAESAVFDGLEAMGSVYGALVKKMSVRFWKRGTTSALLRESTEEQVGTLPNLEELRRFLRGKDLARAKEFILAYAASLCALRPEMGEVRGRLLELYAALCLCKEWGYDAENASDSNGLILSRAVTEYDCLETLVQGMLEFLAGAERYLQQKRRMVRPEILDIQQYVREHIAEELTVQLLAQRVHMNESYFSHLFKRETGQNFADFVLGLRMERARLLLQSTNDRVGDIALAVGIENANYFSVAFKRAQGQTPQEFRRKSQANER